MNTRRQVILPKLSLYADLGLIAFTSAKNIFRGCSWRQRVRRRQERLRPSSNWWMKRLYISRNRKLKTWGLLFMNLQRDRPDWQIVLQTPGGVSFLSLKPAPLHNNEGGGYYHWTYFSSWVVVRFEEWQSSFCYVKTRVWGARSAILCCTCYGTVWLGSTCTHFKLKEKLTSMFKLICRAKLRENNNFHVYFIHQFLTFFIWTGLFFICNL